VVQRNALCGQQRHELAVFFVQVPNVIVQLHGPLAVTTTHDGIVALGHVDEHAHSVLGNAGAGLDFAEVALDIVHVE